jgi:N-acetylglutamate synthase
LRLSCGLIDVGSWRGVPGGSPGQSLAHIDDRQGEQYRTAMAAGADAAAAAVGATWEHLTSAVPGAWSLRDGGAIAWVSGVALPTLNGVWAERADPDPDAVAALLDRVTATGLPYCLQLRPGASPPLAGLAVARAMILAEEIPLMVMADPAAVMRARPPAGLELRELSPEQAWLHAAAAAAGFGVPAELFVQLITPGILRLPGVRCYLGECDGEAVTTGLGVTLGDFTGVFDIATPPEHRRHGYGAAVTARAVADGLAAGAKWSWLQSTAAGYATYARLGFQTVETWPCWIAPG